MGDSTLYAVLPKPDISAQVGVTLSMVGILLGVNRLVRLISNPVAGALYDKYPRRWLLIGSLGIGVFSTLIYAVSTGFWPFLVGRVLWGIAWSGLWIGGNTMVLDVADDQNRGRLSGQFQMWFFIGIGVTALLGGAFTDTFGFQTGLLVSTCVMACGVISWILLLPETRPRGLSPSKSGDEVVAQGTFPWRITISTAVPIFAIRFIFAGVMASTTILWLSEFVGDELVCSSIVLPIATLTGLLIALRMAVSIIGAPIAGVLSDKLGQRWGVMAMILLLGGAGAWLMGADSLAIALGGALVAAVASGGVQSMAPALTGDHIAEAQRSRALGLIYTIGDIGSAIGPPLALSLAGGISIGLMYRWSAVLFLGVALFSFWRWQTTSRAKTH
jgi:MFS family permease